MMHTHTASSYDTATVRDFWVLLKPRVMSLVVLTGFTGLWRAPGDLHPVLAMVAVLCIALAAGAAGALNMWYERDLDALMTRTAKRPLPQGRVSPDDALAFGTILTLVAVIFMGLVLNWMAAGLLAFASFFYLCIYTMWLKPRTAQNIVIGGAAGALPPMIGWVAVTGTLSLEPILLFLIVFLWTPPHFWALALGCSKEYQRAGIPILPITAGKKVTQWQMLFYTLLLFPVTLLPYFLGFCGIVYLVGTASLGLLFIGSSIKVLRSKDGRAAKTMFGFSILYLFAIFLLLLLDKAI